MLSLRAGPGRGRARALASCWAWSLVLDSAFLAPGFRGASSWPLLSQLGPRSGEMRRHGTVLGGPFQGQVGGLPKTVAWNLLRTQGA